MSSVQVRCCQFAILAVSTAVAIGCEQTPDGQLKVYRTSGKVLVNGQPAEGIKVVLYGATPDLQGPGTVAPYGQTDADGEFALTSYELNDGAPAGKFNVTAFWPEPIPAGADEEMYEPKDQLKDQYLDANKSGLKVSVPKGGGELPTFELKM